MKPADCAILDLIPQRPPMVMIDQLIHSYERSARGRLFIKESNVFCSHGQLQEAGMMECIAQTAAAHIGYRQLLIQQQVLSGYIAAIKDLVIHSLPALNTEIQSEVTIENELLGYTFIRGKIFQSDTLLAECEMRIRLDALNGK